jgi:diaminohydroxyphosphoribosylaminopyrimidine deaminase/5-amino-6-(5-phosphoribosylamino)uracil reductase
MALREAAQKGINPAGATAYVTLEPCAHFGRTPPCCDALIAAQVATVHIALLDPNPLVAGQGVARLRAAGIAVHILPVQHPIAIACAELNIGFLSRMIRKRPWVRVKVAASLDGITALHNGCSQWITGPAARADGQTWRARACAILTGIGTVLHDQPRLDVRDFSVPRQPHLVVLDSDLRVPLDASIFEVSRACYISARPTSDAKKSALARQGITVWEVPSDASGTGLSLETVMQHLHQLAVNELHVEGGATLNGALLTGGWVDEWLVYLAPKLLGAGKSMAQWGSGPLTSLTQAQDLQFTDLQPLGSDVRLLARPPARGQFWQTSGA